MTSKDIAAIIFRFFGVYALFVAISLLGMQAVLLFSAQALHLSIATALTRFLLGPLLMAVLAMLLFGFSNQLATKIVPRHIADQQIVQLEPEEIQAILFSFAGILVVVQALGLMSNNVTELLTSSATDVSRATRRTWWTLVPGLVQILLGVILFIKARAISTYWYQLHSRSSEHQSDAQDTI